MQIDNYVYIELSDGEVINADYKVRTDSCSLYKFTYLGIPFLLARRNRKEGLLASSYMYKGCYVYKGCKERYRWVWHTYGNVFHASRAFNSITNIYKHTTRTQEKIVKCQTTVMKRIG